METNEPLFTHPFLIVATMRGVSGHDGIQTKECPSPQWTETLLESRLPVPLYVIAAAALLG